MTIVKTKNSSASEILNLWENHFGELGTSQRSSFLKNKDVHRLTEYRLERIERVIKLRKVQYVQDILRVVKEWEKPRKLEQYEVGSDSTTAYAVGVVPFGNQSMVAARLCPICKTKVSGLSCMCRLAA